MERGYFCLDTGNPHSTNWSLVPIATYPNIPTELIDYMNHVYNIGTQADKAQRFQMWMQALTDGTICGMAVKDRLRNAPH